MNISFFGITFHLYGLLLGLGVATSIYLVEKKAKHLSFPSKDLEPHAIWGIVGALIGARTWHVITDFYLYREALIEVFYVWNGGLSIIGAIIGLLLGLKLYDYVHKKQNAWKLLDFLVFGLPFGQAIGRLGNYVNQELYGLPTQLPWSITIDPAYRVAGYERFSTFHPLFAYEAVLTLAAGLLLWNIARFSHLKWLANLKNFGTGVYFYLYIAYYSVIRFFLEFLRIEKSVIQGTQLGVNQAVLIVIFVWSCWQLYKILPTLKQN